MLDGGIPSSGPGRKLDLIWVHFFKGERNPKTHRCFAACKYCDFRLQEAKLSTLRRHVKLICPNIPSDARAAYIENETIPTRNKNSNNSDNEVGGFKSKRQRLDTDTTFDVSAQISSDDVGTPESNPSDNMFLNQTSDNGKNSNSSSSKEELHVILFRYLISEGLSFETVNNPYLLYLLKHLKTSKTLQTPDYLFSSLLIHEYSSLKLNYLQKVQSLGHVTSVLDSVVDCCGRKVYIIAAILPNKSIFLQKCHFTNSREESVEAIAEIWMQCIRQLGSLQIIGMCSESTPIIKSVQKLILKQNQNKSMSSTNNLVTSSSSSSKETNPYKHILTFPSYFQMFSGIMIHIIKDPYFCELICFTIELIVALLGNQKLLTFLSALKKVKQITGKLVLPTEDDLLSLYECLSSLVVYEACLRNLFQDDIDSLLMDSRLSKSILSSEYWDKLQYLCQLLRPLAYCLYELQRIDITLNEVAILWITLTNQLEKLSYKLPNPLRSMLLDLINRYQGSSICPRGDIAYNMNLLQLSLFLDPKYKNIASNDFMTFEKLGRYALEIAYSSLGMTETKELQKLTEQLKHYRCNEMFAVGMDIKQYWSHMMKPFPSNPSSTLSSNNLNSSLNNNNNINNILNSASSNGQTTTSSNQHINNNTFSMSSLTTYPHLAQLALFLFDLSPCAFVNNSNQLNFYGQMTSKTKELIQDGKSEHYIALNLYYNQTQARSMLDNPRSSSGKSSNRNNPSLSESNGLSNSFMNHYYSMDDVPLMRRGSLSNGLTSKSSLTTGVRHDEDEDDEMSWFNVQLREKVLGKNIYCKDRMSQLLKSMPEITLCSHCMNEREHITSQNTLHHDQIPTLVPDDHIPSASSSPCPSLHEDVTLIPIRGIDYTHELFDFNVILLEASQKNVLPKMSSLWTWNPECPNANVCQHKDLLDNLSTNNTTNNTNSNVFTPNKMNNNTSNLTTLATISSNMLNNSSVSNQNNNNNNPSAASSFSMVSNALHPLPSKFDPTKFTFL